MMSDEGTESDIQEIQKGEKGIIVTSVGRNKPATWWKCIIISTLGLSAKLYVSKVRVVDSLGL